MNRTVGKEKKKAKKGREEKIKLKKKKSCLRRIKSKMIAKIV